MIEGSAREKLVELRREVFEAEHQWPRCVLSVSLFRSIHGAIDLPRDTAIESVAPVQHTDQWIDDVLDQDCVEVASMQCQTVQPRPPPLRQTRGPARWDKSQAGANGVLQHTVIMQQGRSADELQCPGTGVTQNMNQGNV